MLVICGLWCRRALIKLGACLAGSLHSLYRLAWLLVGRLPFHIVDHVARRMPCITQALFLRACIKKCLSDYPQALADWRSRREGMFDFVVVLLRLSLRS